MGSDWGSAGVGLFAASEGWSAFLEDEVGLPEVDDEPPTGRPFSELLRESGSSLARLFRADDG
jgi:hypothetical protein